MSTLREITEDILALDALLEEMGGDVTDEEVEAAIDGWLKENEGNLKNKLDGYASLIQHRMNLAKERKEEARRLSGLATVDENSAKRLKDRLAFFLKASNLPKVETDHFKISLAGNGGKQPLNFMPPMSAENAAEHPVYAKYVEVKYEWDTEEIRHVLENGGELDFARLEDRGYHVRIK